MKKTPQIINLVPRMNACAVLTPQWFISGDYSPLQAGFAPLINGEHAFKALASAIEQAEHSINIITWGFQSSMYMTRGNNPRRLGDLLKEAAERRNVKVRILVWFTQLGQLADPNFPGYGAFKTQRTEKDIFGDYVPGYGADGIKTSVLTDADYEYDKEWHYNVKKKLIGKGNLIVEHREMLWNKDREKASQRLNSMKKECHKQEVDDLIAALSKQGNDDAIQRANDKFTECYPDPSLRQKILLTFFPTHHQKMVVIDYQEPDNAVGFVMGHNMLSAYWDKDDHQGIQMRASEGRDGETPWQDNSSCVCGGIVSHLYHNFVEAWEMNVAPEPELSQYLAMTAKQHGFSEAKMDALNQRLTLAPNFPLKPTMAQICRTQPQTGRFEVETLYNNALCLARKYIYIENQYFRYPPFVAKIKEAIEKRRALGYDKPLYLFVVTNSTAEKAVHSGSYMTYRMLEALGRPDVVPNYHRKANPELEKTAPVNAKDIEGLKVHVCSLVSPAPLKPSLWQPVYVHSKVMMVDDVFLTLGSSNINLRSMRFDSELNIVLQDSDPIGLIPPMRRHLWQLHTGKATDDPEQTYKDWGDIINKNKDNKLNNIKPIASLVEFLDENTSWSALD
ncbi:phosphatidylserine/phosphatidylglycerophosphate/cardiolipin synthase family protein [Citrobacter sp. TSA-1]|uniref:phospholipase D-like domain-containing protein n=1 Tax=Citrobacter sp. TSA-1 TaxID=184912 RepID=UPI000BAE4852|nr:phospholipase D-like domain-containing protein [Citrobacter sp. TSA-1]PAX78396.1 hypothetical protein CIK43_18315 [Citrobacter sp. TSA-1]QKE22107.1 hypothetical protein HF677_021425 [Citrobacter sp. TSA-1]